MESFTQFYGCLVLILGSHSKSGKINSQDSALETTSSMISEESQEPQLSKNSQQLQNKIDQQASRINSLQVQNKKLTQILEPIFLVNTVTQDVASSLNISGGNKPWSTSNGAEDTPTWGSPDPHNFHWG